MRGPAFILKPRSFLRSPSLPAGASEHLGPVWDESAQERRGCPVRRDEAPCGRGRAAIGGCLLCVPAAAERGERAVEADAAGRALPELHAGGERAEGLVDVSRTGPDRTGSGAQGAGLRNRPRKRLISEGTSGSESASCLQWQYSGNDTMDVLDKSRTTAGCQRSQ